MEKKIFRSGYVMVSRTLLMSIFDKHGAADSDEEAFLRVLVHVNFADAEFTKSSGEEFTCLRGESVLSYSTWGCILGWSRGRVKRFFNSCFSDGSIELVEGGGKSHIRITRYDAWMGNVNGTGKLTSDSAFSHFMDAYSEVTHTPRINVGRAQRVWRKMTVHERELALNNIEQYYNNLPDAHYCMQSATYLADKAFLDDYNY